MLEYRQLTFEFLAKLIQFVLYILSSREDTPYSIDLVSKMSDSRIELIWIKALLEQAKQGNKQDIKVLKEIALDALILIYHIKGNLHIIGYYN